MLCTICWMCPGRPSMAKFNNITYNTNVSTNFVNTKTNKTCLKAIVFPVLTENNILKLGIYDPN